MTKASSMISSAVVIPEEQSPITQNSPTSLKRRQSSFTSDANKRPRIDTQSSFENGTIADQGSPTRLKSATTPVSAVEEKKRGKRLFGALLGTLSQTSLKPAHRRRDEIEQRQRERLKKDNEEREQAARRKKEELDRIRHVEQKAWDAHSTKLRWMNMRATANFLQTKTEPRLYYKPWDLRPEEEKQIKQQIEEVEKLIRKESSDHDPIAEADGVIRNDQAANGHTVDGSPDRGESQSMKTDLDDNSSQTMRPDEIPDQQRLAIDQNEEAKLDQSKEDDQGGGELVEGQEDDVMY